MIDSEGYRLNVGIILVNKENQLFWGRRIGQNAWQFPQGGVKENETPEEALFRELTEEIGLHAEDVELLGSTKDWLSYRLPKRYIRTYSKPVCIGQKQKWFMLRLKSGEHKFHLNNGETPEFDGWRWVSYWHPLKEVVFFKRNVYKRALEELEHLIKL